MADKSNWVKLADAIGDIVVGTMELAAGTVKGLAKFFPQIPQLFATTVEGTKDLFAGIAKVATKGLRIVGSSLGIVGNAVEKVEQKTKPDEPTTSTETPTTAQTSKSETSPSIMEQATQKIASNLSKQGSSIVKDGISYFEKLSRNAQTGSDVSASKTTNNAPRQDNTKLYTNKTKEHHIEIKEKPTVVNPVAKPSDDSTVSTRRKL